MNVLILKPRLDVMFKKGPVPTQRGAIVPIREHWKNFVEERVAYHKLRKDNVKVVELPLWQMTPKLVEDFDAELTYIPHKEAKSFILNVETAAKVNFYMQTVFPWLFSIDQLGWGGGKMRQIKYDGKAPETNIYQDYIKECVDKNVSKFEQPKIDKTLHLPKNFVLFPCQLPHDETIKYHSNYSVEKCLSALIGFTSHWGIPLVVKGHPVNPGSMAPLRKIVETAQKKGLGTNPIIWADNVSIHQLVKECSAVYTVNSGVGLEAVLHGKKIFSFGQSDYDSISQQVYPTYSSLRTSWNVYSDVCTERYARFFEKYVQGHIDTRKWVWDRIPR